MSDAEIFEKIRAAISRKIIAKNERDTLKTHDPIKYIKTLKERRKLKYELIDADTDIEMWYMMYAFFTKGN